MNVKQLLDEVESLISENAKRFNSLEMGVKEGQYFSNMVRNYFNTKREIGKPAKKQDPHTIFKNAEYTYFWMESFTEETK